MTAGSELREARERAGISAQLISDRTKIQLFKIEALERDDYTQLPQGIYLDGIVRAYAHEVAIDPEPMVERVRAERGKRPGDWEVPFAAPIDLHAAQVPEDVPDLDDIPVLDRPSGDNPLDGFTAESELKTAPVSRPQNQAPVVVRKPETPAAAPTHSAAAAPRREYSAPDADLAADVPLDADVPRAPYVHTAPLPHRPGRRSTGMLLPILILLAAAGLGIYFYQAARALDRERMTTTAAEPKPDAAVPFSENVITSERRARDASNADARAVPRDTPGISDTLEQPARSVPTAGSRPSPDTNRSAATREPASPRPASPAPSASAPASRIPAAPAARAERPETIATSSSSPDVTGSWQLATEIESSSYSGYTGLKLGYEMQLEQAGDRITGTGRKVSENGSGIRGKAQTPLTVNGTINGDRLTLNFVERGARRPTQGKFVLLLEEDGRLRGRFSSDAARSSGLAEAHRVSAQ